ncbi:MAG: BON domain-containing protein [Planctomycetaceae bacterium]|nr:BON domain-containing protein [Planctomycetaceae bacterium]
MRKICSLISVGLLGFVGMSVPMPSQMARAQMDTSSMIQSMTAGEAISTTDIMEGIAASLMESGTPSETQVSAIEGPLVSEIVVPEANQTVAETLIGDAQTGRYTPRLKINFAEFPLRVIETTNGENNGQNNGIRNGRNGATTDAILQRLQTRLRISSFDLAVRDRTAIISGTVATERQRELIGSMLRFEPGIDAVNNELTVSP